MISKITSIVNINNAAAVLYFLQDVTGPAEVGAVLSALAAQRLVARVINCFYDGLNANSSHSVVTGIFIHSQNPDGPAKLMLSNLLDQRLTITGLTAIEKSEELMAINEANGRNATRPWCTNERSMETCAVILRTIVKSLVNDVILVDLNGEVGSWAIAAVSEGIRSITAVRRPRIMEALTDRLEEAFSTHVKVELPQEPELEKMPDPLDFMKKEMNRILVGLGVPVETASQPLAEAPSDQEDKGIPK